MGEIKETGMNTNTIALALSIVALTVCALIAITFFAATDSLVERVTLLESRPAPTVTERTEIPAPPTVTVSIEISGDGNNTVEVYGDDED